MQSYTIQYIDIRLEQFKYTLACGIFDKLK